MENETYSGKKRGPKKGSRLLGDDSVTKIIRLPKDINDQVEVFLANHMKHITFSHFVRVALKDYCEKNTPVEGS